VGRCEQALLHHYSPEGFKVRGIRRTAGGLGSFGPLRGFLDLEEHSRTRIGLCTEGGSAGLCQGDSHSSFSIELLLSHCVLLHTHGATAAVCSLPYLHNNCSLPYVHNTEETTAVPCLTFTTKKRPQLFPALRSQHRRDHSCSLPYVHNTADKIRSRGFHNYSNPKQVFVLCPFAHRVLCSSHTQTIPFCNTLHRPPL